MRKAIFTLILAATGVLAFAQVPVVPNHAMNRLERDIKLQDNVLQPKVGAAEVDISDRYDWWNDWAAFEGGFRAQPSFFVIYPDTDMVNLFLDENTNTADKSSTAWCSVGLGFDPRSDAWSDPNLPGLRDWFGYHMDSVYIRYGYFRHNEDTNIVDTLLVQFYRSEIQNELSRGSFTNDRSVFSVPLQNRREGVGGANATETIKIPLTASEANEVNEDGTFTIKTLRKELNDDKGWDVAIGQHCHVTVSFKPGQDYTLGDTLYFDPDLANFGITPPVKKYNRFGVIVATQTPNVSPLRSYNNGSFIVRWNRYEDPEGYGQNFPGRYYPNRFGNSDGTISSAYYPHISYHVTAKYDSGLEPTELDNGYGLGQVFPNPVSETAQLSFAVDQRENVQISVFDMAGKKVMDVENGSFAKGEYQTSFSVENLKPGMYVYKMTAGKYAQSHRFNVVK